MKKHKPTSIVCDQQGSRSYGFQCVKGFSAQHRRGGIEKQCRQCIEEEDGDLKT